MGSEPRSVELLDPREREVIVRLAAGGQSDRETFDQAARAERAERVEEGIIARREQRPIKE